MVKSQATAQLLPEDLLQSEDKTISFKIAHDYMILIKVECKNHNVEVIAIHKGSYQSDCEVGSLALLDAGTTALSREEQEGSGGLPGANRDEHVRRRGHDSQTDPFLTT